MFKKNNKLTNIGLILSGGGGRAAYQVGVLSAICSMLPDATKNPFPVIVGTSSGAINAISLASGSFDFSDAVARLTEVWSNLKTEDIYRADWPGVLMQANRFIAHSFLGLGRESPLSLLDNTPLNRLLQKEIDISNISAAIKHKRIHAVAITAFDYTKGKSTTFFQGKSQVNPWQFYRSEGVATQLSFEHVLASSAIPLLFPAVEISGNFFGDGAIRQSAPISPALYLGASKVLIIGVSGNSNNIPQDEVIKKTPTLAQISGHLLNSAFVDNVESNIELLGRLDGAQRALTPSRKANVLSNEPIENIVISPSIPLDQIAVKYWKSLPVTLRLFLSGSGAAKLSGASVLSYLLFESAYCNELIELGRRDALQQKDKLLDFLELN